MSLDPYNEPRHKTNSHIKLTPAETRIWDQYQITPDPKDIAKILGYKPNTVARALYTIKDKLQIQNS